MRQTHKFLAGLTMLIMIATVSGAWGAPTPQTRRWRVGVGGGYCIGYWGMLGRHGLPRERMADSKLADPAYLKQFDVVVIGYPTGEASRTAVEEFVRAGGVAITGLDLAPSSTALPGRRVKLQKGPNVEFVPSDCPASEGLPAIGRLTTSRRPGASIIPEPGRADTYVLARFTDEDAHPEVKGIFRDGSQGAPAIVLFKHGKGWWLWSGTWMGFWTALSGPHFEPAILNTLKFVSNRELVVRWSMDSLEEQDLLTSQADPDTRTRRRSGRGEFARPPEEYEVWDDDPQQAGDFDLTGTLPHGAEAEVVASYWNPEWYRAVRFEEDTVHIVSIERGAEVEVASAPLDAPGEEGREVHIRRRQGEVLVRVDGAPVLSALDGCEQEGVVASKGLQDVTCQPAMPTEFADGFMRTSAEKSQWEPLVGEWKVQQDKGDRDSGQVTQSANPFRYEARSASGVEGRAVVGSWFWDDYHAEVSVQPTCETVGLLGHYQGPEDYIALRAPVSKGAEDKRETQLVACEKGVERVIATGEGQCAADQWCKLGLRLSGGYLQGLIDGKVVVEGMDAARGTGRVGLTLAKGQALFDDVVVRPWVAMSRTCGEPSPANWRIEQGTCEIGPGRQGGLVVTGKPNARVLSSWVGKRAYQCWASVRPRTAGEAGLYVRYLGPREYYLISLEPERGSKVRASLRRAAREAEVTLGETLLGGGPNAERMITARVADEHIQVWIDGEKLFDATDEGPRWGRIGMHVRGEGAAWFGDLGALPIEREQRLVDDLTPSFAGIIDRHTWAGKANFLFADPDDLTLLWHRGEFVSDVTAKLGVRLQEGEASTVVSLFLGDGKSPASGYEMRATRVWDQSEMRLEAFRLGEKVAEGTTELRTTRMEFEAEMARTNGALVLRINQEAALSYQDPQPLDVRHVGMKLTGSIINPDDTRIETPNVRVYTFNQAATDWTTECGTWRVASRWSCSPGWTWFAGWDSKDAWTTNKQVFTGDHRMDMFAGAKMVDIEGGERKQEVLRDIRMALCATPGDITSGYRFIVGGKGNTWTGIQKAGKTVAERAWSLPQAGLHNNWILVSAVKRGNVVSLEWEGRELLTYEDPEPLKRGHVAMGTFDNGLLIPKVTIYGGVEERPAHQDG